MIDPVFALQVAALGTVLRVVEACLGLGPTVEASTYDGCCGF